MHPVLFDLYGEAYGRAYERELPGSCIVAHVHCLPSFYKTIICSLLDIGVPPSAIIVVPKSYSSIPSVVASIKRRGICVIEPVLAGASFDEASTTALMSALRRAASCANDGARRLVLVDDGGILTDLWSRHFRSFFSRVVSVQQTTSGVYRKDLPRWGITYVDVARSAAKRIFESGIIANAIARKLDTLKSFRKSASVGVVGVGAVGRRLATTLALQGKQVFTYDRNPVEVSGTQRLSSGYALFDRCNAILGCTGRNWMAGLQIDEFMGKAHWIASCSSRNVEFKAMLDGRSAARPENPFGTVRIGSHQATQTVLNGGFPINFDRRREWESEEEIFLTRALVFAGIVQAVSEPGESTFTQKVVLKERVQQEIVRRWLNAISSQPEDFDVDSRDFDSLGWWTQRSGSELSA